MRNYMKSVFVIVFAVFTCQGHRPKGVQIPLKTETMPKHTVAGTLPTRRHPFPDFTWADVNHRESLWCCLGLFFAGIMCSAGGLGGGGIFVTVLMAFGNLSPHDAVPLSKSVVFLGSLSALWLNLQKAVKNVPGSGVGGISQPLIDFNICRIVVPSALLGTLLGVKMNVHMPASTTIAMLGTVLAGVALMSARTFWAHLQQERVRGSRSNDALPFLFTPPSEERSKNSIFQCKGAQGEQRQLSCVEVVGSFVLLLLVVVFGVFGHHARDCGSDLVGFAQALVPGSCTVPIIKAFSPDAFLYNLMSQTHIARIVMLICIVVPSLACSAVAFFYSIKLITYEGYSIGTVAMVSAVAFGAGGFAGLIGIGGGMVFSPFFLFIGLDPATAVATSATCIIFTSSSTTFQFLLTDRIALSLGLIYGLVNLAASYIGTRLVHILNDRFGAKKFIISGIVCLGLLWSIGLTVYKALRMASGQEA